MKRTFLSLCILLMSYVGIMAQNQVIVRTTSGEVDIYPFNRDTQIRLLNGKVEFRSLNLTKEYSPNEIANMGFDALIESILLNYEAYALQKGESVSLEATIMPDHATNKTLSWSSSNEDAVVVTQKGKAVYVDDGEAVVTATATDGSGVSASCFFTCTNGIVTVSFNDHNLKIYETDGRQLSELKPGINIIQIDEKTVKKIYIK